MASPKYTKARAIEPTTKGRAIPAPTKSKAERVALSEKKAAPKQGSGLINKRQRDQLDSLGYTVTSVRSSMKKGK